ncbi:unnamed protein product, partial [Prorocentrum cordatum]
DFASALSTAIVVRGSSLPCPACDCACSPPLHCPALECRRPSGQGLLAASSPAGWSTGFVAGAAVVSLGFGAPGGGLLTARARGVSAASGKLVMFPFAAPEPTLDLATAAAAQASVADRDIRSSHVLSGQGEGLPGVPVNHLYQFRQLPRAADVWAAFRRAVALGFGVLPAFPFNVDLSATTVPGLAAGPLALPDPAAPPPAAGAGGGGLGALAAALGGGAPAPAAALAVPLGAAAGAALPAAAVAGVDPRVMALVLDGRVFRDIAFSDAVKLQTETVRADWPVKGPRTLLRVLGFMLRMAGGAMAWHNRWIAMAQLGEHDENVELHETLCRVIETALCHDLLVICELASYEYLARQLQLAEERAFEDRTRRSQPAPKAKAQAKEAPPADSASEVGHLLGTGETKGNLCICPALMDWIAVQMKMEAAVAKERRKAREQRALRAPYAVPIVSKMLFRFPFFPWMGAAIYPSVARPVFELQKENGSAPAEQAASVEHLAGLHREFELPAACSERSSACEAPLVEMLAQAPGCAGDGGRARPCSKPLVAWPQSTKAAPTCDVVSEADSIVLQGWRQTILNPESVAAELRDAPGIDSPRVGPELHSQPNAQFLKQLEAHDMIT